MDKFLLSFPFSKIDLNSPSLPIIDVLIIDVQFLQQNQQNSDNKQLYNLIQEIIEQIQPQHEIYLLTKRPLPVNDDSQENSQNFIDFLRNDVKSIRNSHCRIQFIEFDDNIELKSSLKFLYNSNFQYNYNTIIVSNAEIVLPLVLSDKWSRILLLNTIEVTNYFNFINYKFSCYNIDIIIRFIIKYLKIPTDKAIRDLIGIFALSKLNIDIFTVLNVYNQSYKQRQLVSEAFSFNKNQLINIVEKFGNIKGKSEDLSATKCKTIVSALESYLKCYLLGRNEKDAFNSFEGVNIAILTNYIRRDYSPDNNLQSNESIFTPKLELLQESSYISSQQGSHYFPSTDDGVQYVVIPKDKVFVIEILENSISQQKSELYIGHPVFVNWPSLYPALVSDVQTDSSFNHPYFKQKEQDKVVSVRPLVSINSSNTEFAFSDIEIKFPLSNCFNLKQFPEALERTEKNQAILEERPYFITKDGRFGYIKKENEKLLYFISKEKVPEFQSMPNETENVFKCSQVQNFQKIQSIYGKSFDKDKITVKQIMRSLPDKIEFDNTEFCVKFNEKIIWKLDTKYINSIQEEIASGSYDILLKFDQEEFKDDFPLESKIIHKIPKPGDSIVLSLYDGDYRFGKVIQTIPWIDKAIILPIFSLSSEEQVARIPVLVPYGSIFYLF
ncbi:hypothetical protein TVAG_430180 [Trichomonas vaginalis G3]|uniref:Uncharacterized protein n=1 Tax=Trichomonas vaginalis (strain ATCC PRA-98 / G3) TaxID=412133 RepID=A2EI92_TRIV3|nr:hypothetical protein TVAGG3_0858560 [Trichomonas vaginalis G3]EAY07652.1 hypothetical protein TVAG_430180 [Trichomonas vaginalis G3]KAI5500505.1 hypothetical protein TVAGG3_0858560 [Trichomonas vaginalis G3]|eukprot:XP_001319875.1 hypothetical protein [Trichomonas vaginalis G3]